MGCHDDDDGVWSSPTAGLELNIQPRKQFKTYQYFWGHVIYVAIITVIFGNR